jgi:endonuclease I
MKVVTLSALIACVIHCSAQVPPGYYNTAAGLTGAPLKQALHNIIDGHTTLTYNSLWGYFYTTDDHPTGRVWDIYSDVPGGTPAYTYDFGTDECGQYNNEGDCYNREHSFPKSWFNDAYPMYSDLHAIYPTDGEVNGKRSNYPYGEVGSPDWVGTNGSKTGMNTVQGYSQTVFEPIDAYKGDVARTYFYMLTRYKDEAPNWTSPMLWNGDFAQWAESMLLQWHLNDAVSTKEIDRNNAVHNAQGNRNPYIDNPQWVESIWGPTAGLSEVSAPLPFSITGNELIALDRSIFGEQYYVHDVTGRLISTGLVNRERTLMQLGAGIMIVSVEGRAQRVLR